jgi:pilus assembly protein CpaB
MNRTARTFVVVVLAVAMASIATYLVYRAIENRPVREVEIAQSFAVVAAEPLPLGTLVTNTNVKVVPWPAANPVPGGFKSIDEVVDRGVLSSVAMNEPLTTNNVAGKEAGAGLPPTIPTGMRAMSVRVNEVVGVAGFVVPGTRVDVMVVIPQSDGNLARVVVSNVQVLAAGTRYDQQAAREGKAVPSSVVTLLVSPEDAELVGLASNQGTLLLTLRNPLDTEPTISRGTRAVSLVTGAPQVAAPPAPVRSSKPRVVPPPPAPPPPPPPPPKAYSVEVIRGAKRTEEVIK